MSSTHWILSLRSMILAFVLYLPILLLSWSSSSLAGLDRLEGQFANAVEESSARANQATYESLLLENGGTCNVMQVVAAGDCTGDIFKVFSTARELVQTANELTGSGPTEFSLGVDLDGLGRALRWTAAEEYSGQGSLSSEFVNGQLSGLASRLTALRFGATGFFLASDGAAEMSPVFGMGASEDEVGGQFSRWGGFLNGSYGNGDKKASGSENAFDVDGFEVNLGLDYRLDSHWVTGVVAGYAERDIEFEQVGSVVVDGGIEAQGYSVMPFLLYQSDKLYGSVSLGYQGMEFDSDRAIRYPSLNPNVSSTNTRAASSTDSDGWAFQGTLGYGFSWQAFNFEPYFSAEYRDQKVDGFTERDINQDGFDLRVDDQDIESFEGVLGSRVQYTWTPAFGVFVPYADVQWRNQFKNNTRVIKAVYRGSDSVVGSQESVFRVATDKPDDQYFVFSIGLSTVLRGGRESDYGGVVSGGLQAYLAYRTILELKDYSYDVVTGGLRYEF